MRLNMDSESKHALDTNFNGSWDNFTVTQALDAIGTIIYRISNSVVYRKDFDGIKQHEHYKIKNV